VVEMRSRAKITKKIKQRRHEERTEAQRGATGHSCYADYESENSVYLRDSVSLLFELLRELRHLLFSNSADSSTGVET